MLPDTADRREKVVPKESCDSVAAETQFVDTVSTITPSGVIAYPRNSYLVSSQSRPLKERGRQNLADRLFVSTNMLYDIALTPNIGAGISVGDRVRLFADWMYARWSNHERRRYWRIYGGDIEVRYRIGSRRKGSPLGGHYVGVYGSMACYDFQAGRSHTGVLSDTYNYAAGISYTYSLPVSVHFNIDFSLGIGYLWGKYKTHTPIDDCDVWLSTHKLNHCGTECLRGSLVTFGDNAPHNVRHRLRVYTSYKYYYDFDITDEIHQAGNSRHIEIHLHGIKLPVSSQGGMSPGVDEWGNAENIELPM